ncbi:MAG: hypothetical protein AAF762_01830 [Pseudomonadota bacterium]
MSQISIGDLSQSFQFRRQNTALNAELNRLAEELSSGRKQDIREVLRGDTAGLASLEQGLRRIDAFDLAIKDVEIEVTARQATIETIRNNTQASVGSLLLDETLGDPKLSQSAARDAAQSFRAILGSLNGVVGNRSLFAGTATDGLAVADDETILAAVEAEIALAAVTTPADVEAVVETWFAPGGGYDTVGYIGGAETLSGPRLSNSEELGDAPRADDIRLRETLTGFAMGALVDRGLFSGQAEDRSAFLGRAGERLLNAERGLADLQGEIGLDEGRIERARTEGEFERVTLERARNDLIGADPFETAGQLQSIEVQIRSLYTITGRLSQLSLQSFLR